MSVRAAFRLGALIAVGAMFSCASPAAPALASGPAQGGECAWKQHSKRVVRRVRRHGQWRKVKRVRRWWTCEAQSLPSALSSQPALPASPSTEPTTPAEPETEIGHLGVKAVEWSYTLSRPEVEAGEVIVQLNNQGEDPHNLVLEREGSDDPGFDLPVTLPTSQTSARVTLSPGSYHLYCSLDGHEANGMQATLIVGN